MHRNNTLESLGAGICNPDHGSLSVHNAAQTEFTNFVMDTYHELYRIESQVLGGKPSMALFCRFDVGITAGTDQRVYYFVNEVERAQTTSMWSNRSCTFSSAKVPFGMLGSTFASVFHGWLSDICNPHVVIH
jgi:hypothetical protein